MLASKAREVLIMFKKYDGIIVVVIAEVVMAEVIVNKVWLWTKYATLKKIKINLR